MLAAFFIIAMIFLTLIVLAVVYAIYRMVSRDTMDYDTEFIWRKALNDRAKNLRKENFEL